MPSQTDSRDHLLITRRGAIAAAAVATGAVVTARFAGNAQQSEDDFAEPVASPGALDDSELQRVIAALADSGVAVYATPADSSALVEVPDPGPMELTIDQLRPMVREAMIGGGILGYDLDALVSDRELAGNAPGTAYERKPRLLEIDGDQVIPPSLLLATYLAETESPGADLMRTFLPDISTEQPVTQLYPSLGLMLFSAELARDHARAAALAPAGVRALMPLAAQGGICSEITGFIDRTINALFSALTVDLGPSLIGQILSGLINNIIQGGRIPIKAAIDSLTKPVLDVIRDVAGVLGMVATAVSAIRPWTLQLTPKPAATRLAIGAEPGLLGEVSLAVDLGGFDEWPVHVADCAAQSGVPLPPLKPENARCNWTVTGSRPDLVFSDDLPPALDKAAKAVMKYHTLSESEDTAKGKAVTGWVTVTASVARPEIDDLKKTITNLLFAQLPAIVNQFVRPIIGPVVDQLLGKLASLTDSRSTAVFAVVYHNPPEPTPVPEPEPDDDAGGSVDFTIEPVQQAFPTSIAVKASTCDGEVWTGDVSLSFHPDFNAAWADVEGTSPLRWDFAGDDVATARTEPINAILEIWNGNSQSLSYIFDFAITRTEDEDGVSLIVELVVHATLDGSTTSTAIPNDLATNLGVPIPVTPGGTSCS
jgi:uncharacterized protein YggT (Ycf19 family)